MFRRVYNGGKWFKLVIGIYILELGYDWLCKENLKVYWVDWV